MLAGMTRLPLAALLVPVALAACGDDSPINAAGVYSLNFTAGDNGCNLDKWMAGSTTTGVETDLNQAAGSADVSGKVQGAVGIYIGLLFGTNEFSGRVSGRHIDVVLDSKYPALTQGQCQYKPQLHLSGDLTGDVLTGTLDLTTSTNHSLDCGTKENCHSTMSFNGTRPPH
jgi:hypothetical protein